jgi:RNA polymerase sigma-70 factor (ECF subfamily)
VLVSEPELRELMIRGLDGDAAAHAALLSALVPLLRAFFRKRSHSDSDDVEDMVQESLVAVHIRRGTYDPDRSFTAWLYAIARYKMIDHFRRRRRECHVEDLEQMLIADGFEESQAAHMDIERLLDHLPAKQATAIRNTHLEGFSVSEAAARSGIGESDVKVSVHRGLKTLAARLRGVHR